jgi:thiosulfate dehydrogenase
LNFIAMAEHSRRQKTPATVESQSSVLNAGLLMGLAFLCSFAPLASADSAPSPQSAAQSTPASNSAQTAGADSTQYWHAPDAASLDGCADKELIKYGRELIANTVLYFGDNGKVAAHATNGMNCQNCHLEAGTKVFGNNYSAVASTYPKFRARSGLIEDIYKRINDCFERSLNGKPLEAQSKELQAIAAYINWLGKDVAKGVKPPGSGFKEISVLDRAADPAKGQLVYAAKCQVCHQPTGAGLKNPDGTAYLFPPLWGDHSYNDGAGLYRLSMFAKYVKSNMPFGATYNAPQLSDEEAWDVAAYVNSQPRPKKDITTDWPKIQDKPFDHPFGPYADGFDETQHKYGPFKPIKDKLKKS